MVTKKEQVTKKKADRPKPKVVVRICQYCGVEFETDLGPGRPQKYCDGQCKTRAWRDRQF